VDPVTKEELTIIGTCNMSNRHAHITREFLANYQPSGMLLQAGEAFRDATRGPYNTLESLDDRLEEIGYYNVLKRDCRMDTNPRNLVYWWRMQSMKWFLHTMMRTPENWWKVFTPNLEVKFAIDEAEKQGSHVLLMNEELSTYTMDALKIEKDMDFIFPLLKYVFVINENWAFEAKDMQKLLRCHSLKTLTEEYFNKDVIAWCIRFADLLIPAQKKIFIDRTDEDMFNAIERSLPGKKKVALVN
jgi:hypothetical protein